jgi:glycosyltransferase involved in cell wall biosynthesis
MKRLNLLIVAPFCSLLGEPYFNRFLYLAKLFSKRGHRVTLVTSSFQHFEKKQRTDIQRRLTEDGLGIKVVLIEEPGYVSNVSVRRALSHHQFTKNFATWWSDIDQEFDAVYSAYPTIGHNKLLATLKANGALNSIFILDVQDVWPESIVSAIPSLRHIPKQWLPFSGSADLVYRYADYVFAVSKTYLDRALKTRNAGSGEVAYIGTDFSTIGEHLRLGKVDGQVSVFYIGTLSYSYDLETVIRGIALARSRGINASLHIFGTGPHKSHLEKVSGPGVHFRGVHQFHDLIDRARECDIAVNCIAKNASQSVTNKLSDYLSLGCPILNSQENPEVLDLLRTRNFSNYEAGSAESFLNSLEELLESGAHLRTWEPDQRMNRDNIYPRILARVEALVEERAGNTPSTGDHSDMTLGDFRDEEDS